jgi:hypothetical protein
MWWHWEKKSFSKTECFRPQVKLLVTNLRERNNVVDIRIYDQHIDENVREVECVLWMVETRNTCNIFLNKLNQEDSFVHRVV